MGTRVEVEAFAEEYRELMLAVGSTRLVVDAFANPLRRNVAVDGVLPGDGAPGKALPSFSFDRTMFLGLANSFILEVLDFGSLSGAGAGARPRLLAGGGMPGDGNGLLPFGKATLAAVVAASLLPPTEPLLYCRAEAPDIGFRGLCS